ncbi:MAG TPA: SDR family oxidoreductase [Pseudolysinimonas sp.]|nr:SDR family oxidoreductase [Pseudolysinimonas sp.]
MDIQLTGKRALIVGGTKGIGRATAVALAREGAVVTVAARNDVAEIAATLANETGGTVHGVVIDSRDDASVQAGVAAAVAAMGGVDILVNTAAAPWNAAKNTVASQTSDDAMREEFEEKVLGYLRSARAVAPHLTANGWGRIINVSGLGARRSGSVAQTVRNISVAAITKNLADELGPQGVNVTVVHPGATRTDAVAERIEKRVAAGETLADAERATAGNIIGRVVTPDELAAVIVFLASPLSVAITGGAVDAGGGTPGVVTY